MQLLRSCCTNFVDFLFYLLLPRNDYCNCFSEAAVENLNFVILGKGSHLLNRPCARYFSFREKQGSFGYASLGTLPDSAFDSSSTELGPPEEPSLPQHSNNKLKEPRVRAARSPLLFVKYF